jgi:hypothetical protein
MTSCASCKIGQNECRRFYGLHVDKGAILMHFHAVIPKTTAEPSGFKSIYVPLDLELVSGGYRHKDASRGGGVFL